MTSSVLIFQNPPENDRTMSPNALFNKIMNTPQLEDGYTRVANELLEALLKLGLSGYEFRIAFAIIRKTYGYNKKEDHISLSQITELTDIAKPHVSETITKLISYSIVTEIGNKLKLNKDYSAWKVTKIGNNIKLPKSVTTVTEICNHKRQ